MGKEGKELFPGAGIESITVTILVPGNPVVIVLSHPKDRLKLNHEEAVIIADGGGSVNCYPREIVAYSIKRRVALKLNVPVL